MSLLASSLDASAACTLDSGDRDVCSGCTHTTIESAVLAASHGETICIDAGAYNESSTLTLSQNITLDTVGGPALTSVVGADPIFDVTAGTATIRGMTIGPDTGLGVDLAAGADLTLDDVVMDGLENRAIDSNGDLTVTNSTVTNNSSSSNGGAMMLDGGTATLTDVHIEGNSSSGDSGAMRAQGNVLFQGTRLFICDNHTNGGGASGVMRMIDIDESGSFITASVFLDNYTPGGVGGHMVVDQDVTLSFLTVVGGSANGGGGGFQIQSFADAIVTHSVIVDNTPNGILDQNGTATFSWNYWDNIQNSNQGLGTPAFTPNPDANLAWTSGCNLADVYPHWAAH